jgi:hypothetical protein
LLEIHRVLIYQYGSWDYKNLKHYNGRGEENQKAVNYSPAEVGGIGERNVKADGERP